MVDEIDIQPHNETLNLLIVEDDGTDIILATEVARSLGWNTTSARNSQEAIEAIAGLTSQFHPDVILLDMELGEEWGPDLCKRIRNPQNRFHLPSVWIIGFTAHHSRENIRELLAAGANDFLHKPANPKSISVKLEVARFGHARNRAFKNRMRLLEREITKL